MRFLIAAALAVLLAPVPAAAQDWYRVGSKDNGTQYIDLASVKPDGDYLRANGVAIFSPPTENAKMARAVTIAQYDCKARTLHVLRFEAYGVDGAQLIALDDPEAGFMSADKGTPFGMSLDFICNLDRSKAVRVADPLKDKPKP